MPRESSPRGDTTGNMYTDLGATTREAYDLCKEPCSCKVGNRRQYTPEDRIRQRCSVAVGDFTMAGLMRFCGDPVTAGLNAVGTDALIITDIRMVQVGIQKRGHHCQVICALDHAHGDTGITRSSAGILALESQISGAVLVIGNAPSALLTLCEMIRRGSRPSCS